ncbi:MAG: mandelate racemase/muconate lactonizing enzyme family protein [Bacillota bacterium]
MRISEVKTHILEARLRQPFGFSQWWYDTRRATIIEVETDDGLIGWGESFGPPGPIAATVKEFRPHILGQDSRAIDRIWELLYNRFRDFGQKGIIVAALSGIDIALWDLLGKRYGVPAHVLMGGPVRTRVQAYATGMYLQKAEDQTRLFMEEARSYVEAGFKTVKMKVGFGVERDTTLVKRVREAIGPDIGLVIDANHAYDAVEAVRLGRRIEALDIGWFEEPVCPEDLRGYKAVKSALGIPIAGGESEYTRFGFRDILVERAMDIIQPDVCISGGISECRKIAIMANAFGVRCNPHAWGTGIGIAATLQLLAVIPHNPLSMNPVEPMLELDQTEHPFRMTLITEPIIQQNGFVAVPQGPGLGVEVDRGVLQRYEVNRET